MTLTPQEVMLVVIDKNLRCRWELSTESLGSFLNWYDKGSLTYPSDEGVLLTMECLDKIFNLLLVKKGEYACKLVLEETVTDKKLQGLWMNCFYGAGLCKKNEMVEDLAKRTSLTEAISSYYRRFVSLLLHARYKMFLAQINQCGQSVSLREGLK